MTIDDKKQRIYDLRKKNQELEKFKFVLDYKIKELRRQIEPRELEIKEMQSQIAEMEAELVQYRHGNETQKLKVQELELKLKGMTNESIKIKEQNVDIESRMMTCQNDLHNVVQQYASSHDMKALKSGLKKAYMKHITKDIVAEVSTDAHKEYQRQRYYLEKNVDSLKHKLIKDNQVHKKENIRILQENVALIKEINELRKELKYAQDQPVSFVATARGKEINSTKIASLIQQSEANQRTIRALEEKFEGLKNNGMLRPDSSSHSLVFPNI